MNRLAFVLLLAGCGETTTPGTQPDGPTGVQATFTSLYGNYFGNCAECHAPGSRGDEFPGIEKTLDFTTKGTAYMTITMGMASGLQGNFEGCNGVSFVESTPAQSLIVAVLDQSTRQAFDLSGHPDCDVDSITDETLRVSAQPSSAFIAALKSWIQQGAPNN